MNLIVNEVSKTYSNGVKALDNLTIELRQGMFGLLGPNGAGKSSLMRTIATLQPADHGTIHFGDLNVLENPLELRKILGYLPQEFGVYPGESAESLLDYFALLKGVFSKKMRRARVEEVLSLTNLYDVRKKHVSGYSGGMKRRFGIAQLLLNDPKLIIVDEPTAGLDPAERTRFLNVIRAIGTNNTVIFSTHLVADVKELCQDMAIISSGQVHEHDAPNELIRRLKGKIWIAKIKPDDLSQFAQHFRVLSSAYLQDNSMLVRVHSIGLPRNGELQEVHWQNAEPDLEDVYFCTLKKIS